ncbi:unnamed protein product [Clavelina lepadiformis]|uniref:Microtubule-associated protein 9 n=1 Tax=Clavelina lepadiformis TaxID=159417 RepID=A0ABP0GY37_CLALP
MHSNRLNKPKDLFQLELDKEIAKRKSKGKFTGFSDPSDVDDSAFEEDKHSFITTTYNDKQEVLKSSKKFDEQHKKTIRHQNKTRRTKKATELDWELDIGRSGTNYSENKSESFDDNKSKSFVNSTFSMDQLQYFSENIFPNETKTAKLTADMSLASSLRTQPHFAEDFSNEKVFSNRSLPSPLAARSTVVSEFEQRNLPHRSDNISSPSIPVLSDDADSFLSVDGDRSYTNLKSYLSDESLKTSKSSKTFNSRNKKKPQTVFQRNDTGSFSGVKHSLIAQQNMGNLISPLKEKHDLSSLPMEERIQDENKLKENTDDVSAILDQVTITNESNRCLPLESSFLPTSKKIDRSKPETATQGFPQHSTQMILNSVITKVADHNESYLLNASKQVHSSDNEMEPNISTTKSKKYKRKKSFKTPPADYHGLGSLSAFRLLETQKKVDTSSSSDLRKSIYLEWLANKEKVLKVKKMQSLQEEEKENERKEQDRKEKIMERESARKAWLEEKEVIIKRKERQKTMEQRKQREEKLKKEEERWKSQKKVDAMRQKALQDAKRQHRENQKQKRNEEMIEQKKKSDKKKENQKALDEWMNERSKQWEWDKQTEIKQTRKKEKEILRTQEKKRENAKQAYQSWHTDKNNRNSSKIIVTHHDCFDKPPWSPANQVIPYRG